jgi:FHS family L-fucose permease-like MFS transporter
MRIPSTVCGRHAGHDGFDDGFEYPACRETINYGGYAMTTQQTRWSQFGALITVFFFWGFVAASNDILIPVFKKAFNLSQTQSQLVSFAFYIAYTVGSIIYFFASKAAGSDVLNRIGYKNGICVGLVISALGTLLFYPAANLGSFTLMISGLFVVGLGFSLQQIAANPLAIVMGDPSTGAQRLTMAGGVNNVGTTIGPLIVSIAIFGSVAAGGTEASIENVKTPYLVLGIVFILVALFLYFSPVPNKIDLEHLAADEAGDSAQKLIHSDSMFAAFKYPQLVLGMVAIFLYVGVEVSTAANMPEYLKQGLGMETAHVAPYISLYWASLMIGRWSGAAGAFGVGTSAKRILTFVLPYLAFGVFLAVNAIAQHEVTQFFAYAVVIAAMIVVAWFSGGNPARILLNYAVAGIVALLIGMMTSGMISVFAFTASGLFCSVMWPCIFALAIAGLGKNTNEASSFLIMMICGGAVVPIFQGWVSDRFIGIHPSFIVGVICFAYLAWYAWRCSAILKKQGIDLDQLAAGSGH